MRMFATLLSVVMVSLSLVTSCYAELRVGTFDVDASPKIGGPQSLY